ncbi:hypothetical protein AOLI_G00013680 [Acnodon oligacanthus]
MEVTGTPEFNDLGGAVFKELGGKVQLHTSDKAVTGPVGCAVFTPCRRSHFWSVTFPDEQSDTIKAFISGENLVSTNFWTASLWTAR